MSDKIVYITISNAGVIPFLNRRGPLNSPIAIAERVALNLKAMGYAIKFHERNVVKVDLDSGIRAFVSGKDTKVEPQGHKAEEVLTPNLVEDTLEVTEPTDVTPPTENIPEEDLAEDTDEETQEEDNADLETDETEDELSETDEDDEGESTEVEVYSKDHYASWTKPQLVKYLRKLDEYLPDEVVAKIGSSNKTQLLTIIEKHIIEPSK